MRRPASTHIEVQPKDLFGIMNELFKLKKRISRSSEAEALGKYVYKVTQKVEDMGLYYEDPSGEAWDDTRTDCEASIAGESGDDLVITDVMKPIIRLRSEGFTRVVQKGVVIVESRETKEEQNNGSDD